MQSLGILQYSWHINVGASFPSHIYQNLIISQLVTQLSQCYKNHSQSNPNGQLRYLKPQVRVRIGFSLGQVDQIGILDQTQLQESHSILTTLIMLTRSIFNPYTQSLELADIPKIHRIFQICRIFQSPRNFPLGYSKIPRIFQFLGYSKILRIFQSDIPILIFLFQIFYFSLTICLALLSFIHLDRRRGPLQGSMGKISHM